MPNGDVVEKVGASNCSGSGTTTCDNCIGHSIINEYGDKILEELHPELFNTEIPPTWPDLYGDDILKSFLAAMWETLKDGSFIRHLYSQFNLTVKESAFKIQLGPVGMTFLGAKVVRVGNYFLPAYNSERIFVALCLNIEDPGKSADVEATKAYSLMMLAWNDEELFFAIRNYLLALIRDESGTFLDSMRKRGLPSREEVIYAFWLNTEHAYYNFEEDGWILKEIVKNHNSFKQNYKSYGNGRDESTREASASYSERISFQTQRKI
jgi:hypothetical protein